MNPDQPSLFDTAEILEPRRVRPADPNLDPRDVPRLSQQCEAILAALRERPRTNAELAAISLKYTSRVSDLRAAGYRIDCERQEGGTFVYRLLTPER